MIYNTLHNKWARLALAILGELLCAAAQVVFLVPMGLYTGGLMGLCQVIRTLAQSIPGVGGYDFAGILYYLMNIPLLAFAWKSLGKGLVIRTLICTTAYSLFYSVVPVPSAPILEDVLTSCLIGGILVGVGSGIVLTCGCSGGGLDIFGLALSKRGSKFTVGKFSLGFNAVLYGACAILFSPAAAIYSVIYTYFSAMVIDRTHQQNVNVQAMIFTKEEVAPLGKYVIDKLGRSVTYWSATGAYTGQPIHVLFVCLSKYEIEELRHAVHTMDPHAFLAIQEGVRVDGNFIRRLDN